MKKKKNKKKKKIGKIRKSVGLVLRLAILVILLTILVGGIIIYNKYGKHIINMKEEAVTIVSASSLDTFKQYQTGYLYNVDGDIITPLKGEKDVNYLYYDELPEYAKLAMIAIEDKNFISHNGIDFKANLRALIALIQNDGEIKQGASTITQQLSRNIFLSHEVTWQRKMKEIFIAMELEEKYDKEQIMEFYLNNIYFSNGYYGLGAAAKGYFDCKAEELTLSQIAFLCAIPNNPTLYNPVTNMENTINRRNRILKHMEEEGFISRDEYLSASTEIISLNSLVYLKEDYVETYAKFSATEVLMKLQGFVFRNQFENAEDKEKYEKKYSDIYTECQQKLYRGGYHIYTSINPRQQNELQTSVTEGLAESKELKEDGIYAFQGAAVTIDNQTGLVTAVVGGRKQDTVGYTLNRAYQSYRQPGSAIKPLIVYLPAIMKGYGPDSIVRDEKIEGGPQNSDGRFLGEMTLRTAVEKSRNTVAYQLFKDVGAYTGISFLYQMHFRKLSENDYLPSASIGGFTNGVSPIEMASAYGTIANGGLYRPASCIVKIEDADGVLLYEHDTSGISVYDKNATAIMTDMLSGVLKRGTAKGYALDKMPSAGKTGTTNGNRDGWFVGYTPYYTTCVWVGYDIPKENKKLKGNTYPLEIWHQYMTKIHQGLKPLQFINPNYKQEDNNKVDREKAEDVEKNGNKTGNNTLNEEVIKEEKVIDEEVISEEVIDEEVIDEEVINEEVIDENVIDEEMFDEDMFDEEMSDEEVSDEEMIDENYEFEDYKEGTNFEETFSESYSDHDLEYQDNEIEEE